MSDPELDDAIRAAEVTVETLTDEMIRQQLRIEAADGNRINVSICNTALGRLHGVRGQVVQIQIAEREDARQRICDAINARLRRSTP